VADCILPVDLILQSSEDELIGAHRRNMDMYTDGFPGADPAGVVRDATAPVALSEDTATLKLLLQLCHKGPQPFLSHVPSHTLVSVAAAAEKYVADFAIGMCRAVLYGTCVNSPEHAAACLAYAVKYQCVEIANKAAPATLGCSLGQVTAAAGENGDRTVLLWLQYREPRLEVVNAARDAFRTIPDGRRSACEDCRAAHDTMAERLLQPDEQLLPAVEAPSFLGRWSPDEGVYGARPSLTCEHWSAGKAINIAHARKKMIAWTNQFVARRNALRPFSELM